jgi:hypothetical protein
MTWATIYAAGFLITAVIAQFENYRVDPDNRIPPLGIFLLALLWPLIWAANIVGVILAWRQRD